MTQVEHSRDVSRSAIVLAAFATPGNLQKAQALECLENANNWTWIVLGNPDMRLLVKGNNILVSRRVEVAVCGAT